MTQVNAPMSPLALEASVADLVAWRHETERKIAQLEAEIMQLRAHGPSPTMDLGTARDFAHATPSPATPFQPREGVHEAVTPAVPHVDNPRVFSIVARPPSHPQYDLEMRPGETVVLPDELDGGRKKSFVRWLFVLLILGGLGALIAAAVASQSH